MTSSWKFICAVGSIPNILLPFLPLLFGQTRSTSWSLMPWILASKVYQQSVAMVLICNIWTAFIHDMFICLMPSAEWFLWPRRQLYRPASAGVRTRPSAGRQSRTGYEGKRWISYNSIRLYHWSFNSLLRTFIVRPIWSRDRLAFIMGIH